MSSDRHLKNYIHKAHNHIVVEIFIERFALTDRNYNDEKVAKCATFHITLLGLGGCTETFMRSELVATLAIALFGHAQAIYPSDHWSYSTKLARASVDDFVKENVDAGKVRTTPGSFKEMSCLALPLPLHTSIYPYILALACHNMLAGSLASCFSRHISPSPSPPTPLFHST